MHITALEFTETFKCMYFEIVVWCCLSRSVFWHNLLVGALTHLSSQHYLFISHNFTCWNSAYHCFKTPILYLHVCQMLNWLSSSHRFYLKPVLHHGTVVWYFMLNIQHLLVTISMKTAYTRPSHSIGWRKMIYLFHPSGQLCTKSMWLNIRTWGAGRGWRGEAWMSISLP